MANPDVDQRQCYPNGEYLAGSDLVDLVRKLAGDRLLLSFSTGKDSIAAWLYLREHFDIVPYYLHLVPGLGYVERALAYYEQVFDQKIIQLPHPLFYRMLTDFAWQTPETVATIRALDLPDYDLADVDDVVARDCGLTDPFCAMGIRAKDNLERRRLIQQMGVVGISSRSNRRRFYYPIWDWSVAQVAQIIKSHGLKLPEEYEMFGRTVVALNYRRLVEVKRRYPEDYRRILEWFPLAELELFRYERIGRAA